jgi:alanine dehydrogenase
LKLQVTSHEKPTFIKVMFYTIVYPIFPLVILKLPPSISNIITPYLLQIAADGGIESAIRCDKVKKWGLHVPRNLTNSAIGDWFDLPTTTSI